MNLLCDCNGTEGYGFHVAHIEWQISKLLGVKDTTNQVDHYAYKWIRKFVLARHGVLPAMNRFLLLKIHNISEYATARDKYLDHAKNCNLDHQNEPSCCNQGRRLMLAFCQQMELHFPDNPLIIPTRTHGTE